MSSAKSTPAAEPASLGQPGVPIEFYALSALALHLLYATGCAPSTPNNRRSVAPVLQAQVLRAFPHDAEAFTQGLEIQGETLYESTGLRGSSTIRKVDLTSGTVELQRNLDDQYFGEGVTVLGDRIYQLTWESRTCFVYDKSSLEYAEHFTFDGPGWGLANNGNQLLMSSGDSTIQIRNPETFEIVRKLRIKDGRKSVTKLNELEYFDDHLFANILGEERIAKISPNSGEVVAWIDCSNVYPAKQRDDPGRQVLNGIAHDTESGRTFVTGKNWPSLFEIQIAGE